MDYNPPQCTNAVNLQPEEKHGIAKDEIGPADPRYRTQTNCKYQKYFGSYPRNDLRTICHLLPTAGYILI